MYLILTEDLFQFLQYKTRGISLRTLRIILKQILEATEKFHKSNIINCDLKPENILLKIEKDDINLNFQYISYNRFRSSRIKGQTLFKYIHSH